MSIRWPARWAIFLVFAILPLHFPAPARSATITIGTISRKPKKEFRRFGPLVRHMARRLAAEGIGEGRLRVVKSIPEMARLMRGGEVDIFMDSVFPIMAVKRLAGTRIILRRWKKGVASYRTVIFARKGGPVERLADLKGRVIAFEDDFSTSGFLVPKLILAERRIPVSHVHSASSAIAPGEAGYVFSHSDENSVLWVLMGKVAAGATDDFNFRRYAGGRIGRLRILHESFPVPRQLVSVRAGLLPALVSKIKKILMDLESAKAGREILKRLQSTRRFDEIPPDWLPRLGRMQEQADAELKGRPGAPVR